MTMKVHSRRRKLIIGNTSSEHSFAAEVIAGNADLLTEILIRMPAKSLIRFKCVSKDWLFLISDSQFSRNHSRQNPNPLFSGLYISTSSSNDEQVKSVSLDNHHPSLPTLSFLAGIGDGSATTRIKHSCNGLLLCLNGLTRFIVCNPTTQKFTVLPYPGGPSTSSGPFRDKFGVYFTSSRSLRHVFGAYLAFTPSKSPHYKVILISYSSNFDGGFYLIDLYSSESASWEHISATAPPGYSFRKRVFWNGAIHWMSYKNFHIQFDVDAPKLIATPLPPNPKILSEDDIRYFGECGGHLLLIQTPEHSAVRFRILEMDKDHYLWIVKYWVDLRPIISVFPEIVHRSTFDAIKICKFSVLCVVKGANEKDFTLVLAIPGKIVLYNRKCKTLKVLCDLPPQRDYEDRESTWYYTDQFIESLSPI
ncbi:hypothetical protein ACSBR1_025886 [Camellia fascicularis]